MVFFLLDYILEITEDWRLTSQRVKDVYFELLCSCIMRQTDANAAILFTSPSFGMVASVFQGQPL